MKNKINKLALAIAVIGSFALSANSVKALNTYTQAPPTGNDTLGAEFLISWNGTTFSIAAPSGQGAFDGVEDTLYGIQNNSSAPLSSIFMSGTFIFGLDGDGISAFNGFGGPPGSPGPTGYEGWTSSTSVWGNGTPGAVFFTILNNDNGFVNFTGGIAPGGSAYFALEEHANVTCGPNGCSVGVPDTGSTLLLLGLACGLGLVFQRRRVAAL